MTMPRSPMIILRCEGSQVFWRAVVSTEGEQLDETSKLNLDSGLSASNETAMEDAYQSICHMCDQLGVDVPALEDCTIEANSTKQPRLTDKVS